MRDDLLLGELIVRARVLARDHVARALAELSRRRSQGRETDLASILVGAGLLSLADVERLRRDPRANEPRDPEVLAALERAYEKPELVPLPARPSGRLANTRPAAEGRKSARLDPEATKAMPPGEAPRSAAALSPAPPPPPKSVGHAWGAYEILGEVARGAMGAVYRARDRRRNIEVALKVLLQGNKAEGEDLERFKREARSLARLAHPSIVRVYDYGVHEGCPFLTMDFVAGTTFESILKGGGLPVERGLVILEQVARAVDHAHSRGVVHRDLKPANVLVGADGRARITDFGLAKILDEGGNLTRSGDLIGTPLYMSPEQVRGDLTALGPSCDVWSLGVTLYLLLTGEQPFGGKTVDEVSKRVLNEEPAPPSKLRPGVSPELERICAAALSKDPKGRYQSAGELARDLSNYLHGKPVLAGRVTPGVRARRLVRAVQLRVGLVGALVFLFVFVASATATLLIMTFPAREGDALPDSLGHATRSPSPSRAPEAPREGLALERAAGLLDRGKAAAAKLELGNASAQKAEPKSLVARARVRVLEGDEHGTDAPDESRTLMDSLGSAYGAREVAPALRIEAALAAQELAVLRGDEARERAALAALEQLAASEDTSLPHPLSRRAALALAAPPIDAAMRALAASWWAEPGVATAPPPGAVAGAMTRVETLAAEHDAEACARIFVLIGAGGMLAHADPGVIARDLKDGVRREAERGTPAARSLAFAVRGLEEGAGGPDALESALWTQDGEPVKGGGALAREDPAVSCLVSVALDQVARAGASLPRARDRLATPASPAPAAKDLLASARRVLEIAGRRDPFSPSVRRARAKLELVQAELVGEPLSPDSRAALRAEAAAAVLLDPWDGASCAALARACWACGDTARARTWAKRARNGRRGQLPDADEALAAALLSPPGPSKDGAEIEERAWLELVSGNREEASRLVAEEASLDAEAKGAIASGQLPGTSRLVPASPEASEAFFRSRLAAPSRGTPWAELWAQAALSRETFIDQGFVLEREAFPLLGSTPTGDAVKDLWRALGFVLEVEAASPDAAEKAAAQARMLLESVLERRPGAACARLLLDYVSVLASPDAGEVAEAAADLGRLERVLAARHASPAILEAARALAEARLLTGSAPRRVRDVGSDAKKLLGRKNLAATWTRWNVERPR